MNINPPGFTGFGGHVREIPPPLQMQQLNGLVDSHSDSFS